MPLPGLYSLLNDLKFRLVCETALSLRKRCSTIGSTPLRSLTASRIAILNGRGSCSDSNTFSSDAAESSASRFDVESFSSSRRKSWSSSSTYLEKTAFILSSPSERDISEPVSALDVGKKRINSVTDYDNIYVELSWSFSTPFKPSSWQLTVF